MRIWRIFHGPLCQQSCLNVTSTACEKENACFFSTVSVVVWQTKADKETQDSDGKKDTNKQRNRWIQHGEKEMGWVARKWLLRPLLRGFCSPSSSARDVEGKSSLCYTDSQTAWRVFYLHFDLYFLPSIHLLNLPPGLNLSPFHPQLSGMTVF